MYDITQVLCELARDIDGNRTRYVTEGRLVIREIRNANREVYFLAVEPRHYRRMLLLPLKKGLSKSELRQFPNCKGTVVSVGSFERIGPLTGATCLVIAQTTNDTAIYEAFLANLCEGLWETRGPEALVVVKKVMQAWQNFFSKATGDGLSPEQRRGLFGELSVLRLLLDRGLIPTAVECWKGPTREDVDFVFGPVGLEVKTTLDRSPLKIRVSNENQLNSTLVAQLFLAVLPLSAGTDTGLTIPEVIQDIRVLLGEWPATSDAFDNLLLDAGYHSRHADLYNDERYLVGDQRFYCVTGDFPRVLPGALPRGLENVQYDVMLDLCVPYLCIEDDVIRAIRET